MISEHFDWFHWWRVYCSQWLLWKVHRLTFVADILTDWNPQTTRRPTARGFPQLLSRVMESFFKYIIVHFSQVSRGLVCSRCGRVPLGRTQKYVFFMIIIIIILHCEELGRFFWKKYGPLKIIPGVHRGSWVRAWSELCVKVESAWTSAWSGQGWYLTKDWNNAEWSNLPRNDSE